MRGASGSVVGGGGGGGAAPPPPGPPPPPPARRRTPPPPLRENPHPAHGIWAAAEAALGRIDTVYRNFINNLAHRLRNVHKSFIYKTSAEGIILVELFS